MFGLFKANRTGATHNQIHEKMAHSIVKKIVHQQIRYADWMQQITATLSITSKKILIILFSVIAGGYSLYTIIESFGDTATKKIVITKIKSPSRITQTGEDYDVHQKIISEREFKKIQAFKLYMDSLRNSKSGKIFADSILLNRPELMDSIREFEQLYQLQQSFKK